MKEEYEEIRKAIEGIKGATKISNPLQFFGVVALSCTSIFSIAAAILKDPISFKYCIHMFLAVCGGFIIIALWSPASFYNPDQLTKIKDSKLNKYSPLIPTLIVCSIVALYMFYQYIMAAKGLITELR